MTKRRDVIKGLATLPIAGVAASGALASPTEKISGRDYFKELGVRTFINAAGTYTALTASFMHPEVLDAYNYASKQYVGLNELQDKAGERIAELLKW